MEAAQVAFLWPPRQPSAGGRDGRAAASRLRHHAPRTHHTASGAGFEQAAEGAFQPHSLPMAGVGAGLLWMGWFGFNAGSANATGALAANTLFTTHIAACAGVLHPPDILVTDDDDVAALPNGTELVVLVGGDAEKAQAEREVKAIEAELAAAAARLDRLRGEA